MRPAEKFEAALDAARAAWEAEQEASAAKIQALLSDVCVASAASAARSASAAKIQALLSEGLQMMRERDQARREAAAWRNAYRGATGTSDDTSLSWEVDTIEAGTLLGSVAGR